MTFRLPLRNEQTFEAMSNRLLILIFNATACNLTDNYAHTKACCRLVDAINHGPKECGSYRNFYYVFGTKAKTLEVTKKAVIEKMGKCQLCGTYQNLLVHHIIPVSMGGGDHPENLVVLCKSCHHRVHYDAHHSWKCVLLYMALKKNRDEELKKKYPGWENVEATVSYQWKTTSTIQSEAMLPREWVDCYLTRMEE